MQRPLWPKPPEKAPPHYEYVREICEKVLLWVRNHTSSLAPRAAFRIERKMRSPKRTVPKPGGNKRR